MKASAFGDRAFRYVVVAILAGCGAHGSNSALPSIGISDTHTGGRTFKYTGKVQTFQVPDDVTQIRVIARGANGSSQYDDHFGFGARVSAIIPVSPKQKLYIFVGGNASEGTGGVNRGANGGEDSCCLGSGGGGGGGGASAIRVGGSSLDDR